VRRFHFIAGASALGLAGCSAGATQSGTGPLPPSGVRSGHVPDLRWKFAPLPVSGNGYDPLGDANALILPTSPTGATAPIPGVQTLGSYATDERYVIRVPDAWNGKLVVVGTPSQRSEFANDGIWSDFLLANGYAFACSNKALPFNAFVEAIAASPNPNLSWPVCYDLLSLETFKFSFRLSEIYPSKKPIQGWNDDFIALTQAAQAYLATNYRAPSRTYAVGLSNGGAQVRALLEQRPDLVDGGVDWSGVLWNPANSILDYLPKFLKWMPQYVASNFTDPVATAAIQAAGFPADVKSASAANPSLWLEYYSNQASFYADLTLFVYAMLIDPNATSTLPASAGFTPNPVNPARLPGTPSAGVSGLADPVVRQNYVPSAAARAAIAPFAHTGNIGKPLISIAGAVDMFITPQNNATPYLAAVNAAGKGSQYWQYIVTGGTHVDTFSALNPAYGLQPQLPFAWAAFNQLVGFVERGVRPAGAGTQQTVSQPTQIAAKARAV
jgi:pimeloyl-ACP methyl ester carboxylesterase